MFRAFTAVVMTVALFGLTGCGIHAGETGLSLNFGREADSRFEWSGQFAEGQWLEIKGINGAVNAAPAAGGTAEVTGVRTGIRSDPNEVELVVVEHADGVTICALYPSGGSEPNECVPGDGGRNGIRRNDVKVVFDIQVPAEVRFAGRMVNGAVRAEDLTADIRARTVNGSVRLSTTRGTSAKTVNGSIRASFRDSSWNGEAAFETVNGSIRLNVSPDINANLNIRTANGRITTNLPVDTTRATRRRVEGTLGDGGPTLRLKTVNGSATLGPVE